MARSRRRLSAPCFGAPFLPRPPQVYGELLRRYLSESKAATWLVNTGWTGGAYGVGQAHFDRAYTGAAAARRSAAHSTARNSARRPYFSLSVPLHVPGVPDEILDPARAWPDPAAYAAQARRLVGLFEDNFVKFAGPRPV